MCPRGNISLLSIVLICWASFAQADGPSCSDRFKNLFVPRIQIPIPIPEWARSPYNEDYKNLYRWMNNNGINPRSYDAQKEASLIAIRQLKQMGFGIEEMSISNGLRVTQGMLKNRYVSLSQKALLHPMMPKYLEELERMGGTLKVWPAAAIANAPTNFRNGAYWDSGKTIAIMPTTTWEDFIHEYQHFVFHQLGLRGYNWNNPEFLKELRKSKSPLQFGLKPKEVADEVKKLSNLGLSNLAVDETIAVKAQTKALAKLGYGPWTFSAYKKQSYAWEFQEKELEQIVSQGHASAQQKLALASIKAKKVLLHPVVLKPLVAAAAGSVYYYREETKELLVVAKDGAIQAFNLEEFLPEAQSDSQKTTLKETAK